MAGVKGMKGCGGPRVGAGRKPRAPMAAWLMGDRRQKPVARAPVAAGTVACPVDIEQETARIWAELAPLATAAGTLEPRTAMAFADLCAYIVIERRMRADPASCGGGDHRGMIARIEAGRVRFRLIADGKAAEAPPVDEWAEFDAPLTVVQGGKGQG